MTTYVLSYQISLPHKQLYQQSEKHANREISTTCVRNSPLDESQICYKYCCKYFNALRANSAWLKQSPVIVICKYSYQKYNLTIVDRFDQFECNFTKKSLKI